MDKRERDMKRAVNTECAKFGARAVRLRRLGSGHFSVEVETQQGKPLAVTFSFSPSDSRSQRNELATLRRLLRGETQ